MSQRFNFEIQILLFDQEIIFHNNYLPKRICNKRKIGNTNIMKILKTKFCPNQHLFYIAKNINTK